MDARKKYEKIRKKYKLPKLEELEDMFAFKLAKDSENDLYDICKGILESIDFSKEILENILFLHEGSPPSNIYEANFIETRECFRIYRKIMELKWKYVKTYFDSNEKNLAEFINESYKSWNGKIKKYLIDISERMEKAWKNYKEKDKKNNQTYLG